MTTSLFPVERVMPDLAMANPVTIVLLTTARLTVDLPVTAPLKALWPRRGTSLSTPLAARLFWANDRPPPPSFA